MKIISIINQKGGTGKTTTAINLGVALARMGKRVLLVDLDPQANLSYAFGITSPAGTMADVLEGKQALQGIFLHREGLDIAPASPGLADVEVSLISTTGGEQKMKNRLVGLTGFDYVFIDCPPSLSVLTANALTASDELLIPTQVEILALQGLSQLLSTIKEVKEVLNKNLRVAGVVVSMYDYRRSLSGEVLAEIKKMAKVFDTVIRENVRIAEAPSFAKSVLSYAPTSHGAEDYLNLAREFIKERS